MSLEIVKKTKPPAHTGCTQWAKRRKLAFAFSHCKHSWVERREWASTNLTLEWGGGGDGNPEGDAIYCRSYPTTSIVTKKEGNALNR